jgi:creatinine amidohydrolase/Fe(II)-dependent formamide hydrolase-like protein
MNGIDLNGKMNNWGPFGVEEGKWLIFTIGNPNEGHGFALPRMVDDFHAKYIAHRVEFKTGSRYVAHIPYTTDRCGVAAQDWAPQYLPEEEFIQKTISFIEYHLKIYREMGLKAENVLLIIGHGGNLGLMEIQKDIEKKLNVKNFICKFILNDSYLADIPKEFHELFKTAGHASHIEHSLAAAMEVLDYGKLDEMNQVIETNFDKALENWPPIGGLGGYISSGGKYADALGTSDNDKYELWSCLDALKSRGKIEINKELGKIIIDITINQLIRFIQDN